MKEQEIIDILGRAVDAMTYITSSEHDEVIEWLESKRRDADFADRQSVGRFLHEF